MSSHTFGRSKRLSRGRDFQRLLREGKGLQGESLLIKVLPNGRGQSRFAWSVRRTIVKTAVSRNRLKRCIREAFRRNQEKIPPGFDWIAIVSRMPKEKSYLYIDKEVIKICSELSRRFF